MTWIIFINGIICLILIITSFGLTESIRQIGTKYGDKYTQAITINIQDEIDTNQIYLIVVLSLSILVIVLCFFDDLIGILYDLIQ